ncbi:uncharacterized protein LOC122562403 [Chiloscyllium plagiosum]|uniref:uncharacterized protein LOC122562403 n=1 Tax=Chiloscyllium plagiosum TaxID=36176 RepID=UPI001CB85F60|nr:uncharacterized protein LOC122562403 [Chiloscyllium plagiosum]
MKSKFEQLYKVDKAHYDQEMKICMAAQDESSADEDSVLISKHREKDSKSKQPIRASTDESAIMSFPETEPAQNVGSAKVSDSFSAGNIDYEEGPIIIPEKKEPKVESSVESVKIEPEDSCKSGKFKLSPCHSRKGSEDTCKYINEKSNLQPCHKPKDSEDTCKLGTELLDLDPCRKRKDTDETCKCKTRKSDNDSCPRRRDKKDSLQCTSRISDPEPCYERDTRVAPRNRSRISDPEAYEHEDK